MRAWRFHEAGDIHNLLLEETEAPNTGPGETSVRLKCAALNPADRYLVQGQYPRAGAPPFTPGRDGAGTVVRAAEKSRFKAGDKVCILGGLTGISRQGTLAEECAVPDEWLAPVPEGWTCEQAAAAPLVHLTAWRALKVCGELEAGETVLITGASGGVGTASIFLAKSLGAHVIALSRDSEKRKALEALGADVVLDSAAEDLEREVKKVSGDRGVTLTVENLGGPFLEKCVRMSAPHGRILVVGLLADLKAEVSVALLIHKNLRLQGLSVSAFTSEEAQNAWKGVLECYARCSKRPIISRIFPMGEVQEAFEHMKEGHLGKVVIRVKD